MNGRNQKQALDQAGGAGILHCLWMDAGVVDYKLCDRSYDCERCPFDEALHSQPQQSFGGARDRANSISVQGCELSPNLFYHPDHTWARVEEDGIVRVGLDDFGQRMLGVAYSISLPPHYQDLKAGEGSWTVTHQSGVTTLASPVSGKVLNANSALRLRPALINRDPYGDGWTMTIEPANLKNCLQRLMYGERVRQWLTSEIEKLHALINQTADEENNAIIPTMTDGGLLRQDFLNGLSVEQTRRVISAFFPLSSIAAEHQTAILVSNRR